MSNQDVSSNTALGSRSGSGYPMQSQHGRVGDGRNDSHCHIACNRCRKSLSTTIFVCSCDCVFCEECTYSHFNNSSKCPVCQKSLGAKDFMELVVADPSSATEETLKNTFQTVFTKFTSSSNILSHQEMCSRLLKNLDDDRRIVRFLLKQFVFENKTSGRQSGTLERAYNELKVEYTNMKQAASSQRIQTDQIIADLRHRVQALTGNVQQLQTKVDEKDIQINQFRRICKGEVTSRLPGSSHSNGSGSGHRNVHHNVESSAPPMPGFVMQKQAREHEKEQALQEVTRSRAPINVTGASGNGRQSTNRYVGHSSDMDSIITPIQVPPPNHYLQNRRMSPSVVPNTPRIRDLSAGSSYIFTSSSRNSTKRPRHGAPMSSPSYISPVPLNNPSFPRSGERRAFGGFVSR